jgi:hypothetical protein
VQSDTSCSNWGCCWHLATAANTSALKHVHQDAVQLHCHMCREHLATRSALRNRHRAPFVIVPHMCIVRRAATSVPQVTDRHMCNANIALQRKRGSHRNANAMPPHVLCDMCSLTDVQSHPCHSVSHLQHMQCLACRMCNNTMAVPCRHGLHSRARRTVPDVGSVLHVLVDGYAASPVSECTTVAPHAVPESQCHTCHVAGSSSPLHAVQTLIGGSMQPLLQHQRRCSMFPGTCAIRAAC